MGRLVVGLFCERESPVDKLCYFFAVERDGVALEATVAVLAQGIADCQIQGIDISNSSRYDGIQSRTYLEEV